MYAVIHGDSLCVCARACVCVCVSGEAAALATKAGCVELLMAALKTHSGDASVTTSACDALGRIFCNNGDERHDCMLTD